MDQLFSTSELQAILKSDTGFNNLLHAMPGNQGDSIRQILLNENVLADLLQLLPETIRAQAEALLKSIFHTPQKAKKLYDECRFMEARKLLNKTISLYSLKPETGDVFLDQACEFVVKRSTALLFNLLGEVEWELGNKENAEKKFQTALTLAREVDDIDTIAKSLYGLGTYYWKLDDFETSLTYNNRALALLSGHEDQWQTQHKVLTNLCGIHADIGQYSQALDYGHKAVSLCEKEQARTSLPISCNNLACLYIQEEAYDSAMDILETGLQAAKEDNALQQEVMILNNMAVCFLRRSPEGRHAEIATSLLARALSIVKNTDANSLKALTFFNLGLLSRISGKNQRTKKYFTDAIDIYREIGSRSHQAQALNMLGVHLAASLNDTEGALNAYKKSIDIIETIRGGLVRETFRISYADTVIEPYEKAIDCLLALHRPEEAFVYAERAKSRTLMEFLSDKLIEHTNTPNADDSFSHTTSLLRQIEELQTNLAAVRREKEACFFTRSNQGDFCDMEKQEQDLLDALEKKDRAFTEAYSQLVKKKPETALLIKCAPQVAYDLPVRLDPDTLLLNFFQAEKNLHLLIRFPDGFIARTTIAVTMDEAFEMVKCQIDAVRNPDNFQLGSHEYIGHIQQPMGKLYGLLFADLEPLFKKYRRIIISPHLFWHYFPFHALFNKHQKAFLCDQVEIGYCPSASILHHCMAKNKTHRQKGIILARNNGDLAHVEKEATLVAASFSSEGTVFSGKAASLDQIETAGTEFDIIHLACHGHFNHEQPFLSGIDIPVNQNGKERTYLLDLFHRTLNCNLVSISACDSGLNSYTAADELIGLSRGLFCAGAASVLLSLWQVADASTCYMMENFYWHYIQNRQTKTRALQLAMQAVKSKPEYAHPYFWAPFVVMGDWR